MYSLHASHRANPRSLTLCVLTALCLLFVLPQGHAQFGDRLLKAAQRGAERALERKAEQKTGEAVDNTVDEATKKPEKKDRGSSSDRDDDDGSAPAEASSERGSSSKSSSRSDEPSSDDEGGAAEEPAREAFSMASKYDFEPGANIIHYDDFSRSSVGDLPTGYNTMGGTEVMTVNTSPHKFIKISGVSGQVVAMDFKRFPENFTLEFDVIHAVPERGYRYRSELGILFTSETNPEAGLKEWVSKVGKRNATFWIDRDISRGFWKGFEKTGDGETVKGNAARIDEVFNDETMGQPQRISIWRQGKRMRMYINQEKAFDIPLAWSGDEEIKALRFVGQMSVETDSYLVGNIRLAEGAPDMRSKLVTEGKLTTYGITFASGSADVEPSSSATLKQIAKVLEENGNMKLKITGHTDADGSTESNQSLSEKRAAAVKTILVKDYGLKADRLSTAGAGESDPIATGDTPSDKARNRRVVLEKV